MQNIAEYYKFDLLTTNSVLLEMLRHSHHLEDTMNQRNDHLIARTTERTSKVDCALYFRKNSKIACLFRENAR